MLKLRPQLYDVIITEPSNPWTMGVGDVFSREFYELAARRLKPGGLVCQWFHTYEMEDDILALILPHIQFRLSLRGNMGQQRRRPGHPRLAAAVADGTGGVPPGICD